MRKLKLFFACLLMAVLSIGQVWAADVTFTPGTETGATSVTKSGVTCTMTTMNNASYYQIYANQSGTFEVSSGNITKIEFTCTASGTSKYGPGNASADVGSYSYSGSKGTWTGEASTVTISSTAQIRMTALTITVSTGSSEKTLSVSPAVIDFGTVEQNTVVANKAVAVTYANLTGSVTYSELSSPFTASGSISTTGDEITIAANTATIGEYEQTLTVQSANDNKSADVTVRMNVIEPFNGLQLTFPDEGTEGYDISSYTADWTATMGSHNWDIYGFNSYKWQNNWTYIKTGRKKDSNNNAQPVTATIVTQVTDHAVGDIVVTVDAVTATQVTSHKLYVADNSSFDGAIEIAGVPATIAAGNITYTVPIANRANDLYYKLEYATAGTASGNGILTISKITYAYAAATPQKASAGLAFDAAQKLAKVAGTLTAPNLSTADGFDGTVTYASSDEAVVKVNASTGAITEIVAVGKAVITAHSDETENFKEGSASYTIYVATEAGTDLDPLTEASAKALIDLGCTMSAHVKGTVNNVGNLNTTYGSITLTLAGGLQYYGMLDVNGVQFESNPFIEGDVVTAVGNLKKHNNTTYELDVNCQLVERIPYTAPKTPIVSDIDNPITVAAAIGYIDDPVTYDLSDDVWVRGVVTNVGQTNGAIPVPYIDVKDANAENSFRFYNYTVNSSITEDPQQYDILIATGKLDKHNTTYELNGCEVVDLVRPDVAVTSVELDQDAASIEVNETVTLHATVKPDNASNKAITWSVQSGSTYASVENGVVTGFVAGEAVIRAASTADPTKYAECTVTVTPVDPTKHVVTFDATVDQGESPLSKSNISMACSSGALNNESEYRLYKSSTTTFECSVGNIIKIEFTGVSGNPVSGFGDPEVGTLVTEGNNGVWTGNAESVSFVASGAQVRATEIVVTYKEDNRAAAGLTWSTDAVELTVGDEFTAPALQNPNSIAAAEITIESDNENLAEVNAGVVSLVAEATGTATITATFNGNDDYKPATISYTITVNEAGLDNVTFDSSEDHAESGETTITKGGFTLSFTSGSMDGTQAEYRLYKGQTMTLSSTDYKIKKIEFTCTSGNPISGFADATGLDKDNNEWTGESNTVELTASNAQVRMTKIKVFYVEDTRAAAGLAWDPADDIELTVGDALSAPALLNPNSIDAAEITIESSNTSLATVTNGEVALVADATGTTTITATFAGNDDFKSATVSYKITINPAYLIYVDKLNVNFGSVEQDAEVADKKVTVTFTNVPAATLTLAGAGASAFTISPADAMTASGDITISASSANVGTFAATLTISDDDNNAESKTVNLSITVNEPSDEETPVSTTSKWVPATAIEDGMQVLITGVKSDVTYAMGAASSNSNNRTSVAGSLDEGVFTPGENTMPFTLVATGVANTYYIKTSNNQYIYNASTSSKSYLRTKAEQEEVSWTITLDGDNNAVITSVENTDRQIMRFNTNGGNDPLFNCYANGQTAIKLYVPKPVTPVDPTPDYTRTVEINRYGTICLPNGGMIEGAKLYDIDYYDGTSTLYLLEVNGNAMVAGRPYIFLPSATLLEVFYTDEANASAGTYRGLVGSYSEETITADAGNYILYENAYYLVNSTARVGENRAYIHMESVPTTPYQQQGAPRRRVAMNVYNEQTTTDIDALNASEAPVKMIIDGQLFIIRGEKMYNVNGQVVK